MTAPSPGRLGRLSVLMALTALAAGCGGGGGDASPAPAPAPAPPPSPGALQVNNTNVYDAYWLGSVARTRILGLAAVIDASYTAIAGAGGATGTVTCPGGGQIAYVAGTTQTLTFSNCVFPSLEAVVKSGALTATSVTLNGTGAAARLAGGSFTSTGLVYATTDAQSLAFGVDETMATTVNFARQTNGTVSFGGSLTATRNGRADQYTQLTSTINNALTTGTGAVDFQAGAFTVTTPRFASQLRVTGTPGVLTLVAPDSSLMFGAAATNGVRYVLQTAPSTTPVLDTTLADSDPVVQAAVTRVLQ